MKWQKIYKACLLCGLCIALTACGSDQSSSNIGYKEMKTMVVDILKSDEGKKAVEEASKGSSGGSSGSSSSGSGAQSGGMQMMSAQTSEEIRLAVKNTMTAPEYQKEIEKIMTDPKFAGDFAKAINSQSKELHLQLIKDPTYQKSLSEIMKSPEMMTMFLDLTKTPDYRKQSMTVMQEAMQNPLFRMEVLELLKTVVQEELQPKVQKEGSQKEQQGSSEGGGGSSEKEDAGKKEGGKEGESSG